MYTDNSISAYGCVKCQDYHYEDELIYQQHIGFQSKHGVNLRPVRYRGTMTTEKQDGIRILTEPCKYCPRCHRVIGVQHFYGKDICVICQDEGKGVHNGRTA